MEHRIRSSLQVFLAVPDDDAPLCGCLLPAGDVVADIVGRGLAVGHSGADARAEGQRQISRMSCLGVMGEGEDVFGLLLLEGCDVAYAHCAVGADGDVSLECRHVIIGQHGAVGELHARRDEQAGRVATEVVA